MKKLLALLLLVLTLSQPAMADGPPRFSEELSAMPLEELSARCVAALSEELPGASVCTGADGAPLIVREDYAMFAVMTRKDGLMTLCCFRPDGDGLAPDWHNDLLLSYYQDITLTTEGATWSGGVTPHMSLFGDQLQLSIPLADSLTLRLIAEDWYDRWQVTEIAMLTSADGAVWQAAVVIPEDCLADDIHLETCIPSDWRYREE